MVIIPYMACSVFLFLIFQSIGTVYNPLSSITVSVILSISLSVFLITLIHIIIKKKESFLLEEFKEIDMQSQRILDDLEKFEKRI